MMTCPAECSGKHQSRQRQVLAGERTAIESSGEILESSARICSYCGCVYTSGVGARIIGYLDGMSGTGWKPAGTR